MGICQVALRSKDIIVGRAEKGRAESGWSMGELPGSPSFQSRVVGVGGGNLHQKHQKQTAEKQ